MIRIKLSTTLFIFFAITAASQTIDSTVNVKIVFAGDIMGHGPQINAAFDSSDGTYDYTPCFRFIKPYVKNADIAIGNLEVTLGGPPFSGYPVFSSPDALAVALKDCGFSILSNANNHCYDKGKYGFERTLQMLDSLKITSLGTYLNPQQRDTTYPLIIEEKGMRIAILNYTYGTNGIVPQSPNVVNLIERSLIKADIEKAKEQNVDFIIGLMHWGNEYELVPNKQQRDLAMFMAKNGCNAIVGSHPHVVQTFEILYPDTLDSTRNVPVFYSLGNFVSNQRNRYRDGGAIYSLSLKKDSTGVQIDGYNYYPYWVYRGVLNGLDQYYILPVSYYNANKQNIKLPEADIFKLNQFYIDISERLNNIKEDR